MHWGFAGVVLLAGCIEGPENENAINNITARPCETGVPSDATFELQVRSANYMRLGRNPPRFEIATADGRIDVEATLSAPDALTLHPLSPLPADDFALELVDLGELGPDAYLPAGLFPAAYSGRPQTVLRSYRAVDNQVFVSFSRALDPATVATSIVTQTVGLQVRATIDYFEGPGHIVHLRITDDARPVDITFGTGLHAADGTPVFQSPRTIQVDPVYELPEADGCEFSTE